MSARLMRLACAFCGLGLLLASGARSEPPDPDTQQIMAEIVDALRVAFPLSLDDEKFGDPANREAVSAALDRLATHAERLDAHGADREVGFAYLSGTLARESLDIRRRYAEGRVDQAAFLLRHLTETCVACHSRLPDDHTHTLGRQLTEQSAIAALPREDRVQFEVATRQFDRALATYESLFSDPSVSMVDLDLSGDLESYLEICLRVQEDPDRAISNLEKLSARPDLPGRLKPQVETWIQALRTFGKAPAGDPIAQARALVEPVLKDSRAPGNPELVRLIVASGMLHRYVVSTSDPHERVGEAYYLLGVVESRIGRSFWASQTEFFLETAIRMGPKQRYADDAFALLEEFLVSGFTGSSGTHVPPDVVERLADLDELMKSARAADPG